MSTQVAKVTSQLVSILLPLLGKAKLMYVSTPRMYPRSEYFRVDNEDFPHRYLIRFALLLTKLPLSSSNSNICDALIFYALANKSLSSENLNFSFCFGSISQFQFKVSAYSHAERGEKNSQLLLSPDHIKKGTIYTFHKQKETIISRVHTALNQQYINLNSEKFLTI